MLQTFNITQALKYIKNLLQGLKISIILFSTYLLLIYTVLGVTYGFIPVENKIQDIIEAYRNHELINPFEFE